MENERLEALYQNHGKFITTLKMKSKVFYGFLGPLLKAIGILTSQRSPGHHIQLGRSKSQDIHPESQNPVTGMWSCLSFHP